ncbi:MAG TPA: NAD(P)H-hydrate epimerase [Planctomycetota bacterium]|nr:NAD(P)H-hydrate epimerase [Planctomycetota bacterium]
MGMESEPGIVLSRRAVRELDRLCLSEYGIPGIVLMENAGRGVAESLLREFDSKTVRVVFLCGPGNNGGDAFVAARHLHNAGIAVRLFATSDSKGDAAWARGVAERMGLVASPIAEASQLDVLRPSFDGDVVLVDALLGTGAEGVPRGAIAGALRAAAKAKPRLRVALDLPSGLDAQTGKIHDPCFRADLTLTFAARKPGLSAEVCGRVTVIDIGAPRELLARLAGT